MGFVLDYDMELIDEQGAFTVLECEQTHNRTLEMNGVRFNFTYTPDRIDHLADGKVRIVDYKTGKDETIFTASPDLRDLFEPNMNHRRKAILQLFLYCYAYLMEFPEVPQVQPVIYKLSSMKDSGVRWKDKSNSRDINQYVFSVDNEVAQVFIARMAGVIGAIYDEAFVQAPENVKSGCCNYCRFIDFCRRAPSKSY